MEALAERHDHACAEYIPVNPSVFRNGLSARKDYDHLTLWKSGRSFVSKFGDN